MPLSSKKLLLSLLLSLSLLIPILSSNPSIGITYSRHPNSDLHLPYSTVSALRSLGVVRVRVLDPDPDTVRAFSKSGISLLLSIPNTFIHAFAANQTEAVQWLYSHVVPFYPRAHITTISVGNEVLTSSPELSGSLLPAIRNVYLALRKLGIRKISVSTAHSFDVITSPFPPSAAEFQEPDAGSIMKPLLNFLSNTNSSFLINAYPYKVYRTRPDIPLGYVLFENHAFYFRDNPMTRFEYWNLFDLMVDAVIRAIEAEGHQGIPVVVTETGWPSDGDANEPEANEQFATKYNEGLVRHLRSGIGTPLRREEAIETYIFELFDDEETKEGPGSDRHWGIVDQNMTMKYDIVFSDLDPYRYTRARLLLQVVVTLCLLFVLWLYDL